MLFSESRPAVVISFSENNRDAVMKICGEFNVAFREIGTTGGDKLVIGEHINAPIADLKAIYESAIPELMGKISHD